VIVYHARRYEGRGGGCCGCCGCLVLGLLALIALAIALAMVGALGGSPAAV
jgi:hypothetical protein